MKKITVKTLSLFGILIAIWLYVLYANPVKMTPQNSPAITDYTATIQTAFIYSSLWIVTWFIIFGFIPFFFKKSK